MFVIMKCDCDFEKKEILSASIYCKLNLYIKRDSNLSKTLVISFLLSHIEEICSRSVLSVYVDGIQLDNHCNIQVYF